MCADLCIHVWYVILPHPSLFHCSGESKSFNEIVNNSKYTLIFRWHLPRYKNISQRVKTARFIVYSLVSFGVPLILVVMAISAQEPGQSSYYLKGVIEASRTPLNYFIPPISSILFICFGLLVGAYFGFRNVLDMEARAYITQRNLEDGASFYNQGDVSFKVHIDDVERT